MLPDDLYQQVKMTAAADSRTVTSLIEEALRQALRQRVLQPDGPPYRVRPLRGRGIRPGLDLDDGAALLATMELEDGSPA